MKSYSNRQRGFTLLEMLTVIAIMSVMLVAFGGGFYALGDNGAQYREAQRLSAALQAARADAIAAAGQREFEIDIRARSFGAPGTADNSSIGGGFEILFTGARELADARDTVGVIRFYADGSASGGLVTFRSEREIDRIEIDWLTGRIETRRERVK